MPEHLVFFLLTGITEYHKLLKIMIKQLKHLLLTQDI